MKKFSKLIAFVLCLVTLASTFAFAVTPAAITTTNAAVVKKQNIADIVSPVSGSATKSDSLLVSVKLNKAATVKVTIYEEKIENRKVVTTYVSGVAITKEAISYTSVDVTSFGAVSSVAITSAAATTTKEAVSGSAVNASSAAVKPYVDKLFVSPVYYTSKDELGFYTGQVNDVKPGLYKMVVEVVEEKTAKDKDGKEYKYETSIEKTESIFAVQEKPAEEKTQAQTKEKANALTIITTILKSLFK